MVDYAVIMAEIEKNLPTVLYVLVILAAAFIVYKVVTAALKRTVISKARTKKQRNNAMVLLSLWRYAFFLALIISLLFYLGGDITGLGIWAGLLTAALGWALQRPITGIAAWIMVITKKPFQIGDRIEIAGIKGDVADITLTHICLKELGGTIATEETSGRVIMIPNSKLFEQDIINYTLQDEYILDQVIVAVTYESDLDRAMRLCTEAAEKVTKEFSGEVSQPPYVRTFFQPSGIDIKIRYHVKASERIKIASEVTQEVFKRIKMDSKVEIAYPHTEVLFRHKPGARPAREKR
jgi:small-conductance mechanosensitive channel